MEQQKRGRELTGGPYMRICPGEGILNLLNHIPAVGDSNTVIPARTDLMNIIQMQ